MQPLAAEAQVGLYRIAQESLNNIVKHAHASHVEVVLRGGPSDVELTIADDGCGFEPDGIDAGHLGLRIMRERAEAIGATFDFSSRVGEGTRIRVNWKP
jgi:signal transduction histidine kinase